MDKEKFSLSNVNLPLKLCQSGTCKSMSEARRLIANAGTKRAEQMIEKKRRSDR